MFQVLSSKMDVSLTHTQVLVPNDEKFINFDKLRIKKPNKTHGHMLMGEVSLNKEFGNNIQLLCLSYKKAGNDYKLLPYKVGPTNFCKFLDDEKMFYPDLQTVTDLPDIGVCPWPVKTYHIFGFQPDLSKIPPVVEQGDYMVECQFNEGEKMLNGIKVFGSLVMVSPMG